MDLQEKLNEVQEEIQRLNIEIGAKKIALNHAKSLLRSYLKLIEKAKALEK